MIRRYIKGSVIQRYKRGFLYLGLFGLLVAETSQGLLTGPDTGTRRYINGPGPGTGTRDRDPPVYKWASPIRDPPVYKWVSVIRDPTVYKRVCIRM